MSPWLSRLIEIGLAVLAFNVALCAYRLVRGPSPFDRIMALECITFNLSGAVVLTSVALETPVFFDVLLVIALLGFIGTVALTAYLGRSLGA